MSRPESNTPEYRKWRQAVFKRDRRKCKVCGATRKLQAHHIKRWADFPMLRYEIGNGITLCRKCHGNVWGKEEQFEAQFYTLINPRPNVEHLRRLYCEDN